MRTEREKRRCARIFSSCSRTAEWITAGWVDCDTLYRTLSMVFGPKGNPVLAGVSNPGINGSMFAGSATDNAVHCESDEGRNPPRRPARSVAAGDRPPLRASSCPSNSQRACRRLDQLLAEVRSLGSRLHRNPRCEWRIRGPPPADRCAQGIESHL